ncbi:MAG: exonuclease domain-containing protein [Thermoplasmatota archaeon]
MHLLAVDTETCALGPGRDRLVQFCVEELDGNLRSMSRWTQLVNPGRPIPKAATAIHGITDEMVRDEPGFAEVGPALRGLFRPGSVLMAYNAGFDHGVLDAEFVRCGAPALPPDLAVIDPLQVERRVTSRSLGPTYKRYTGRDLQNAHTADADVAAMVEVLRRQREVRWVVARPPPDHPPSDIRAAIRCRSRPTAPRGACSAASLGGPAPARSSRPRQCPAGPWEHRPAPSRRTR